MKEMKIERLARMFRAVSNPKRLRIVRAMMSGMDSTTRISDFIGIPYKTVERHVKVLQTAGFVTSSRNGLIVSYFLETDGDNIFSKSILNLIEKSK